MSSKIQFPSGWNKVSSWSSYDYLNKLTKYDEFNGAKSMFLESFSPSHFIISEAELIVRDQGIEVPCCVSMATIGCMEILDIVQNQQVTELSPLFHYYKARGGGAPNVFLTLLNGVNSAVSVGVCPELLHPSFEVPFGTINLQMAEIEPSEDALINANTFRIYFNPKIPPIVGYRPVQASDGIESWKLYLSNNHPIMFALWLNDDYERMHETGDFLYQPSPSEILPGRGHAVIAFGYDDTLGAFRILDSRGTNFFDNGFWWLSYKSINSRIILDACAVIQITY